MEQVKPPISIPTPTPPPKSLVEVGEINGASRLTASRSIAPLKIINPGLNLPYCPVILSSYGGGFVEGDQVQLDIHCGAKSKLYLGTQASTRVYKCPRGLSSGQQISGRVEEGALAVVIPNPLVLHKDSLLTQFQTWNLRGGMLILVDWFSPGRTANEEIFQFQKYQSQIQIEKHSRPVLIENFISRPDKHSPFGPGVFGKSQSMFNLYAAGDEKDPRFLLFTEKFSKSLAPYHDKQDFDGASDREKTNGNFTASYSAPKKGVYVFRGLGRCSEDFKPVLQILGQILKEASLLGHDPISRKF